MRFLLVAVFPLLVAAQSPIICEDTISGQAPFNNNDIPCLLGCGSQIVQATGSLLPGSVNITAIPYCRLDCVRKDATPAQSSIAPACNAKCENGNAATPDQLGWCMYWCVEGGSIEDLVVSTTCVPQLQYVPVKTSTIESNFIVTIEGFTTPPAWASWYQTQTVLSRSSAEVAPPTVGVPLTSTSESDMSSVQPIQTTSHAESVSAVSLTTTPPDSDQAVSADQTLSTITTSTASARVLTSFPRLLAQITILCVLGQTFLH